MNAEYRAWLPGWLQERRGHGVTTSVDTNWDPDRRWAIEDLLRSCDWYFPNEVELEASTGTSVLARSLDIVSGLGSQVAVKRGPSGGLARSGDRLYRVRQTPPVDFVDAIGAGDTFAAGFIAGLLSGEDIGRCLALAVTAGTLSTAGSGGTSAQADRETVELLAGRLKVETESA
jgi:sugar/nucleoside kinase (ribokinase family)